MPPVGIPATEPRYEWDHFVALSGDPGRGWLDEYSRPDVSAIAQGTDRALMLLRRREFEPGHTLLRTAGMELAALRDVRASVVHVLERWYHGVWAFYCYCIHDYAAAQQGLLRADEAIRSALENDRFLLPLAHHCHEFHLHHARIARNLRLWDQMRTHVEIVRGMVDNQRPLCRLSDGTNVDYGMLGQYHSAVPELDEGARQAIRIFVDAALRRRLFERFVLQLYLLPGFVVSAPLRS